MSGLRINPMHAEGEVEKYDPSAPFSRLGFPIDQLDDEHMEPLDGIHFHNLCEQGFEPLRNTWDAVCDASGAVFRAFQMDQSGRRASYHPRRL